MTRSPKPHIIRVTHNGKEQIFKIVQTIADDEIHRPEARERYLSKFQICQKPTLRLLGRRSALNVPYGSES